MHCPSRVSGRLSRQRTTSYTLARFAQFCSENHPHDCLMKPLISPGDAQTTEAPGGGPLHVKVDATGTMDDGPFPLRFDFRTAAGQQVLSNGVVCLEYPEGTGFALVQVYVTDGAGATGFRQMFFNIHTPGVVIDGLLALVQIEFLGIRNQRPYRAPLEAARSAFSCLPP